MNFKHLLKKLLISFAVVFLQVVVAWSSDSVIFVDTITNESLSYNPVRDEYVVRYLAEDEATLLESRFELPNKANARVSVNLEKTSTGFRYGYSFSVNPNSVRAVMDFTLRLDSDILTDVDLGNYLIPNNWTFMRFVRKEQQRISWFWSPMHHFPPPLFESVPPTEYGIKPGENIAGFGFDDKSGKYLPGIVDAIFYSVELVDDGYESESPEKISEIIHQEFFPLDHGVTTRIIGPRLSPTTSVAICDTFILVLIGQVREAAALGWIKHDRREDRDDDDDDHGKKKGAKKGEKKGHDKDDDGEGDDRDDSEMNDADKRLPGVAKSIIKKLTKVRRECLRGKFGTAREKLLALIKQVNAQRGKKLTDEAYTLIKFNAEFLLEKL